MDIGEVVAFFEDYSLAEYREAVAVRAEPDSVLDERRRETESFLLASPGVIMSSGTGRRPGMTADELKESARTVNREARRVLFGVVTYRHAGWGEIFAVYAGGTTPLTVGLYGQLSFIADVDGELKIIAQYAPEILEEACPMPWTYTQGVELESFGEPVAVTTLVEPSFEEHRQDWSAVLQSVEKGSD
ncbi:hypothetical protein [Streptomyces hydrogenans]|uniref:hypothetical protein n=1 Tax=Streptomyces hydrogenans TaxID=1873719 RepID=UPI00343D60AA